MTVYLVVLNDRHTDTEVTVFRSLESALRHARRIVSSYGYEDPEPECPACWHFHAKLSTEGDYVFVTEAEVMP